jgi:hypothetical protein
VSPKRERKDGESIFISGGDTHLDHKHLETGINSSTPKKYHHLNGATTLYNSSMRSHSDNVCFKHRFSSRSVCGKIGCSMIKEHMMKQLQEYIFWVWLDYCSRKGVEKL